MSKNSKLVSVIIPTYNCEIYINQAVDSVFNQTYDNIEIIVVDDGSTDNTRNILRPYIEPKRLTYFYQSNKGPATARNRGILAAKGEYVAFLDADDLWEREKLSKSLSFMEEGEFDWVCTALKKITMKGELIEERKIKNDAYGYNAITGELYDLFKSHFSYEYSLPVHGPTMLIRKECFEKVGLFDEKIKICEDTDLTLRFQEAGLRGGFLDEMLTIYRLRENSTTKNNLIDGLEEHRKVAKKHAKILGLHKREIRKDYANLLWEIAARYYINKKWLNTLKLAGLSLIYYPDASKLVKITRYLKRN